MSGEGLARQLLSRVGQCVLTSPGSACYAGIERGERLKLGGACAIFGDGYEIAKRSAARRLWRIPVMDGEFVCEHDTGLVEGAVGGGNLLFLGRDEAGTLAVAEAAAEAAAGVADVILPFPGRDRALWLQGRRRRTKGMMASTNDAYCPTLKGRVAARRSPPRSGAVLEIVIDGLSFEVVSRSMRAALHAAASVRASPRPRAGDGRQLRRQARQFQFHLRELLA